MVVSRIGSDYSVNIPDAFRELFEAGQEVAISADAQGRLVSTPVEQIQLRLQATFGMWADRDDLPTDGVDYMDDVRRGQRLSEMGAEPDEAD